ncbi:MAG: 3-hydroxyacyl-CoA dehydrogenase NAD-binding domain-containing protein [Alphaproteobacteria bacterium]
MVTAAVIGLGTMGPGIAATLARGGMTVRGYDTRPEAVEGAGALIAAANNVLSALGTPERGGPEDVSITDDLAAAVRGADLVIETVPEDLELKRKVFREIDALVSKDCVLASDTSGIPISRLQEGVSNPGRVVGMHWSNPPHIIPVVEVIAGAQTSQSVVARMIDAVKGINLIPIVVRKDVPGFVENRVLYALLRECVDLVEQGVIDAEGLDACVSWGIGYKLAVVGPMALLDMAGLDIYQAVGSYLNKELCARPDVSSLITARTREGRLGMKTGSGIFDYTPERIAALRQARAGKLVAARKALEG